MTNTDITPTKLVVNCVDREQWNQARVENRIKDDEVWVVSPDEQLSGFNKRVVEVLDPVERTDAATKNYVDSKIDAVEADIQTKQPRGDYLTPSTTLADLENVPGFQTAEEVDQKIAAAPFQPKGDYVTTDNDYVTEADVSRVVDDARIRKLWNQNLDGYTDSDGNIWRWSGEGSTYVDKFARITDLGNVKELFSDDGGQKILGNGEVWREEEGYWTAWEYSDGIDHGEPEIVESGSRWRIVVDIMYTTDEYSTLELAQAALDGNSLTFNYATESITASRTWIEGGFRYVDDLALKSDIPESGISEDEARTIIESYDYVTNASLENRGFRTYDQVESQITAKGYRTEQQVESQIEAKGYVTESRSAEIAAQTLPEGYAQDEVVGTLEDGSEVRFYILTKAVS